MQRTPVFEATFRVTRENCRILARAKTGQHRRTIWLCNLLVALCVAILWVVRSANALWLTGVLAVLLLHSAIGARLTALRLYAARNASVDVTRLSFCEEGICVQSSVEETFIHYPLITELREDGRFLMLYMRHHTPLVVDRQEVAGDRGAELTEFLQERTGLEIRAYRR